MNSKLVFRNDTCREHVLFLLIVDFYHFNKITFFFIKISKLLGIYRVKMNDPAENSGNLGGADVETLDYLLGVKSSTCLLLPTTPSPSPMDFKHPLSEEMNEHPFLTLNDESSVNIQTDASAGDSSSSGDSNSVVQDPVSAQLINNISMLDYQTLSKNGDLVMGETEDCKLNGNLNVNNRKLPSFVNWNWGVIRKILLWIVLSGLIACLGAIITMVITIPKECNPDLPWFQGKVFYEVSPASFKDSNDDGTGDLKGLLKKLDYIQDLGATAIRLNYIFPSKDNPEHNSNITNLMQIDSSIGAMNDFEDLTAEVHKRNMSLVLDIPVISMATPVSSSTSNYTNAILLSNDNLYSSLDPTSAAIAYWALKQKVDGFYLKNLENFVDDPNFARTLQIWKHIVGVGKIFIGSEDAYVNAKGVSLDVLLSRIDLIDIHLDLRKGINQLKNHIDKVLDSKLWEKPYYPWVHWNIGNIENERVSDRHMNNTLALTALVLILPGTVSIYFGDEIGLGGISKNTIEGDFHELKDIHNMVVMKFSKSEEFSENQSSFSEWNSKSDLEPKYHFLDVIKNIVTMRLNTPTIYLRATFKDGKVSKNMKIRETEENLIVIERWFPRRNTCVFVGNFGNSSITTDLSTMFYGGTVIASTNASLVGQVLYFDHVSFPPNSALILKLEK